MTAIKDEIEKKKEEDIFDGLYSDENIPESNWAKFEKVGDHYEGILVEIKDKPAKDVFPAQRVYSLKQKDGEIVNVGIGLNKDYVIGRANSAKMGDILGFKFVKEVPSATKGFAAAKSIEVFVKHVEGNEGVPF
jgi:hypothetical protein